MLLGYIDDMMCADLLCVELLCFIPSPALPSRGFWFSFCFALVFIDQNSSGSNVVEEEMEPEPFPPNLEKGVRVSSGFVGMSTTWGIVSTRILVVIAMPPRFTPPLAWRASCRFWVCVLSMRSLNE